MPFLLLAALCLTTSVFAQTADSFTPVNTQISAAEYRGQKCVRVMGEAGLKETDETLAVWKGSAFRDGIIELEVASTLSSAASAAARGFIGVAFRVQPDPAKYDAFYLRPTNARAGDQVRRNHSVQYIAHPAYPWNRLRKEFPEMYESYSDMEAGAWTRVKIEVRGRTARLYVNGAAQPCLVVNELKGTDPAGAIALWIGPGTIGHFRNLTVRP
jgi:hypothetical protein